MELIKVGLYALSTFASLACTLLLVRGYQRRRFRLLLWSAICFACLTINNILLFLDLITFPSLDLRLGRLVTALVGVMCMLYAFLWESE